MRKTLFAAALVLTIAWPSSAFAWGFAGHKLIMSRAIDLLPPELKPFFDHFREEIVIRVTDPDLWRNIGWDEDQNHFVDFGVPEFGRFPFAELPRDYDKAVEKFGVAFLKKEGTLPWREQEEFGNLRRAFEGFKRSSPYATSDATVFAAIAAHYIQDAHQPFHATDNFDGAQTGNNGIHARFERDLIERFESKLTLTPVPPRAIANSRDAAFDALLSSYQLVAPILAADKAAIAGKDTYDDDYFQKFFTAVKPILERRLSEAITATAGVIIGAWEQAGKPTLTTEAARPIQRVRPGR
jgi:hypothetical protein